MKLDRKAMSSMLSMPMVITGVALLVVQPAAAAWGRQWLAGDIGYGYARGNYIEACDYEADNRGVFVEYRYAQDGYTVGGAVGDANGSRFGCGYVRRPGNIVAFHVCLRKPGSAAIEYCEPWLNLY